MKRIAILFLVLALLMLSFSACAAAAPSRPTSNASGNVSYVLTTSGISEPLDSAQQNAALHTIAGDGWGGLNGNEHGYYSGTPQGDSIPQAWRLDYAAGQLKLLCTKPNCSHTDISCEAFLGETQRPSATIHCDANALYWVFGIGGMGTSEELLQKYGKAGLSHIDVSDLDGGNRRTVYTVANDSEIRSDSMATDGTYLYCATKQYQKPITVQKVALADGTATCIATLTTQSEYATIPRSYGAFGGALLWGQATLPNAAPVRPQYIGNVTTDDRLANRGELFPYLQNELFTLSLDGKTKKTIFSWLNSDYVSTITSATTDGAVWCGLKADGTLETVNLSSADKSHKVLGDLSDLPDLSLDGIWDNHAFLWSYTEDAINHTPARRLFAISLLDGTRTEIILQRTQKGEQSCVLPIVETKNDFLVISDETPTQRTILSTPGTPYTIDTVKFTYALISKADYYAGTPNYRTLAQLY